jgi:hypothetical protein
MDPGRGEAPRWHGGKVDVEHSVFLANHGIGDHDFVPFKLRGQPPRKTGRDDQPGTMCEDDGLCGAGGGSGANPSNGQQNPIPLKPTFADQKARRSGGYHPFESVRDSAGLDGEGT